MNCPKCSGHTRTYNTKYGEHEIVRRRVCESCGYKFTTTETYTDPEDKPKKKKRVNRAKRKAKVIYVKYDDKPPFLPIAVADSISELAEILGVSRNVVSSSFSHKRSTYKKVSI